MFVRGVSAALVFARGVSAVFMFVRGGNAAFLPVGSGHPDRRALYLCPGTCRPGLPTMPGLASRPGS
jgi:hypothetical protein